MKKLLQHYLKQNLLSIIIASVILLVIVFVTQINRNYIFYQYPVAIKPLIAYPGNPPFGLIIAFAIILSVVITIVEFSFQMKKVTVDQLYSLPIKRSHLYLTKYFLGLIEILVPVTLSFILMIIMIVTKGHMFNFTFLFPYYIGLVILTVVLFTCLVFVYTRCNSVIDGIINMALYILAIPVILLGISGYFNFNIYGSQANAFNYTLFSPLIYFNTIFEALFCDEITNKITINDLLAFRSTIIVGIIQSIAMGVTFFYLLKKQKSEDAEQKTNSLLAYKSMIPIYTFFLIMFSIHDSFLVIIIIIIASYIGYVIKNRSFKLSKQDLITWIITISSIIVLHLLFEFIKLFILGL